MLPPLSQDPDLAQRPVVAKANDYPSGALVSRHLHRRAQLIFVRVGALRLETENGVWTAPPGRAAWIPANVVHSANYTTQTSVRVAYINANVFDGLSRSCAIFALTGLLRELVIRAIDLGWNWPLGGAEERAMHLLVDEIVSLKPLGLFLPLGRDARLRHVIDALKTDPGDARGLECWARAAGASPRTLARLFLTETGLTFGQWREQLRLTSAIERLAEGHSITRIALDLGYASSTSFTTMFTRAMGQPPRAYLASLNDTQG
jgi:AraC-like DNA-binding protein